MAKEKKETKKTKRPTAEKRMLQNKKRRLANKAFKSSVRTAIRRFEDSLSQNDEAVTKERLGTVYSLVDKGVKKGIYKRNMAGRTKSRLAARQAARS